MSDVPVRPVTGVSAIVAYALVTYKPDVLLFSRPSFFGTFFQIWTLCFSIWAFWKVILYPKYFSPLRHLPGPEVIGLLQDQGERRTNDFRMQVGGTVTQHESFQRPTALRPLNGMA